MLRRMVKGIQTLNRALSFPEAKKLEKENSRLVGNSFADKLLLEGTRDPQLTSFFSSAGRFWTRTVIAYPASNCPFGFEIRLPNLPYYYVLNTGDYRGEKGIALLFEDFDFFEDGRERIYDPRNIITITDFPQQSGWFNAGKVGLPQTHAGERYIWRTDRERVGPIVRNIGNNQCSVKDIFMHHRHSEKMNVLFEDIREGNVIPISRASQK